jgi:two-component system, chemotaxis family, chemotaxis protein CheY
MHRKSNGLLGAALVVEDDEHVRALIASLARQFGFERVVEVATLGEALDRLDLDPFALALIDLALGAEDGGQLIYAIRTHQRLRVRSLPVVVVSRCTDEGRVLGALKAGADGFVAKPITIASFCRQVSTAMAKRADPSRAGQGAGALAEPLSGGAAVFEIE